MKVQYFQKKLEIDKGKGKGRYVDMLLARPAANLKLPHLMQG